MTRCDPIAMTQYMSSRPGQLHTAMVSVPSVMPI